MPESNTPHLSVDAAALDAALRAAGTGAAGPQSPYARGVLDLLRLLGLVPPGEVRAMLIASLRAHLADGVPVGLPWDDLDSPGLRGVDVLRAVESARVAAVPDPTPGRVVRVVQAVIKARRGAVDLYLMQYDDHAGRYQPLGGKQEPGDASPQAALRREIAEELGLDAIPGPAACPLAALRTGWRTTELSATYGILTAYEMDIFTVTALGFPLDPDDRTRWLSPAEIAAGRAADGRSITSVYQDAFGSLAPLDALPPVLELPGG